MKHMIWQGKHLATVGELGTALCELTTTDEATEFWRLYVDHLRESDEESVRADPEGVARSNIGYVMGYYGEEERDRVYELFASFDVSHPLFGRRTPTPEEALKMGQDMARGGGDA